MVIAKIIQNLANNIFFGKEAHMIALNVFLGNNIANVTRFLSELHVRIPLFLPLKVVLTSKKKYSAANDDISDHWLGTTSDDTDVVVLHRFFHKHADKIGKELLSLSKPTADGDFSAISGKRAWDGLCALLVDLGPPLEVPRLSTTSSADNREFLKLIERNANRDTGSVRHLFLETDVKVCCFFTSSLDLCSFCIQESTAVFVLPLSKVDVEGLDIELFMFYILKVRSSYSL